MLVLKVEPGDYVLIGDNIMVRLMKDEKDNYKLAIDAPNEYNIVRSGLQKHTDSKNS